MSRSVPDSIQSVYTKMVLGCGISVLKGGKQEGRSMLTNVISEYDL